MKRKHLLSYFGLAVCVITAVLLLTLPSCSSDDWDDSGPHHAWMGFLSDSIGDRMLRDIALPASHDAGMNEGDYDHSNCMVGTSCNTVAQTGNIATQLAHGSRYFDIRPVVPEDSSGADWCSAHGDLKDEAFIGCEGECKQDIVDDLQNFFADSSHDNELVILDISHSFKRYLVNCPDEPCHPVRSCTQSELDVLYVDLVSRLPRLVTCYDDCNLMEMTLNEILKKGNIILLMEGNASAKEIGAFRSAADLPTYGSYANTENYPYMVSDQLGKLKGQYNRYSSKLFSLSFTLTLSEWSAAKCEVDLHDSILEQAAQPNGKLLSQLESWVGGGWITKSQFPNIIWVDAFDKFATDAAIYLNGPHDHHYVWESGTSGNPGAYYVMQGDGNLCIYLRGGGGSLWCSHTGGNPGAKLCMRPDGNMVIYKPSFDPLWSTGTDGHHGAYYVMGADGNFVIKDRDHNVLWATHTGAFPGANFRLKDGNFQIYIKEKVELWSTGTGGHPGAYYRMQDDGNFVIYHVGGGHALWATGTGYYSGAYYVMGEDGNFVIKSDGKVRWQSHTNGNPGAHYEMQDDGNFVIYKWEDRVLWESGTGGHPGAMYGMLHDGNFVVFMPNDKILWESGTAGHWGAYHHMQDDGNLKIWTEKWDR